MSFFKGLIVSCLVLIGASAHAAEFGSKEEAKALVAHAAAYYAEVGQEKAFAAFNDQKGKFVDRDLYIVVYSLAGMRLAHGQNEKMIGKSVIESVDVNGKAYGSEVVETAKAGEGWVEYNFSDPVTKKILPKSMYVKRFGDLIFGSGVYLR